MSNKPFYSHMLVRGNWFSFSQCDLIHSQHVSMSSRMTKTHGTTQTPIWVAKVTCSPHPIPPPFYLLFSPNATLWGVRTLPPGVSPLITADKFLLFTMLLTSVFRGSIPVMLSHNLHAFSRHTVGTK